MRTLVSMVAIAALALGCRSQTDREQAAREDVKEQGRELAQATQEGQKDVSEAQRGASKDVQEQRQDLTEAQRKAAAASGNPVTVEGRVQSVSKNEFALKTNDGQSLDINIDASTMAPGGQAFSTTNLTEGSEVRATYTVRDGDNYASSVEVVHPAGETK